MQIPKLRPVVHSLFMMVLMLGVVLIAMASEPPVDSDGDGLPDAWEMQYFGSLTYGAAADPGGVGRTQLQSYQQGLNPWSAPQVGTGLRERY